MKNMKRVLCLFAMTLMCSIVSRAQSADITTKIQNKQQLTNLPTIYLTVPDAIGKDINSVVYKDRSTNTAEYHSATIQVVDNSGSLENFTDDKLEIKVRGNSTADDQKKPYRLKFGKDKLDAAGNVIETHKHDMIGGGYKKRNWTLLSNHKDASLLRNAITYHVGRLVGMDFCPGYKFVDLVINGQYRGNYMLSDHVEVGSHRVELDDEDTGWFIESTISTMVEEPKVTAGGLYMTIKNPEPVAASELADLKSKIADYYDKLNGYIGFYKDACSDEQFRNPTTGWRSLINEESFLKFYIAINLTDDYDGFMSVKQYRDIDGKLKFGPLWDKDLAYGNWQNHGKLCEEYQTGYTFAYYAQKLTTDPVFIKKVHDKFHKLLADGYVQSIKSKLTELGTMLTQSQALNQNKWWTSADYPADVKKLSDYIDTRVEFLSKTWDDMYEAAGGDNITEPTPGTGGEGDDGGDSEPAGPAFETEIVSTYESGSFTIPASSFNSKATSIDVTITRSESEGGFNGIYAFNGTPWNGSSISWTTGQSVVIGITDAKDITAICTNGIHFALGGEHLGTITAKVVNHGTAETPETPTACTHTFTTDNYNTDSDGILHRTCSKCGAAESDVNYYSFTIYPESATTQTLIAQSWTPAADKPNSIAVVTITSGLEKNIIGYNIVNSTKNADGNQTCDDFRLADGHPYYSDKKFTAAKATYTRKLSSNEEYGTMILPYKYQNASVAGADFYHINKVENGKVTLVAIDPSVEGNASAYTPVVFKRKGGASSITVTGTDITVKKSSADKSHSTCEGWTLTGAVENTTITSSGLYQISNAQTGVMSKVSSVTVAPFRAYFSTTTGSASQFTFAVPAAVLEGDVNNDGKVTISDVPAAVIKLNEGTATKQDVDDIVDIILGK